MANDLREKLIDAMRERFPNMQQEQIGFFVGAARIDYRPQIRLERQIYHGMQTAGDAVRDAEQQRKKQLTRELRDIIRRKRVTTLFQPIVRARDVERLRLRDPDPRPGELVVPQLRHALLVRARGEAGVGAGGDRARVRAEAPAQRRPRATASSCSISRRRCSASRSSASTRWSSFFAEHRGHFVFELTERAAIEDYAVFRALLDEFRDKGIEVAIDDAGSGYASLEAIAALAPDYLKVTKGLVSTLAAEPIKQDLVKMLVELAGKIGAKTHRRGHRDASRSTRPAATSAST